MLRIRLFLMLLCAGFAFSAHAQESIVIDFYYVSPPGAAEQAVFARYAEQFAELHPGIEVVPTFVGGYDDIRPIVLEGASGGMPQPDVAVMLAVDLFTFIDAETIIHAQQFIDQLPEDEREAFVSDFFPVFLENCVDGDGTIWTLPFQRSTPLLYYNRDLFRDAGLDPDQAPRNREELLAYAQALTIPDERYGLLIPSAGFPYWLYQSFAIGAGQNVVGSDPTEVFFDTPAAVDGLEFFVSLSREHGVMPEGTPSFGDAIDQFFAGDVAMIYQTSGNLRRILDEADFEVGVGYLPSGPAGEDGTGYGTPVGGGNLYLFSNSTPEEQQAAWLWAQYLASPEIQADWTNATGYIAARQSAWETDTLVALVENTPEFAIARDQLEYAGKELNTYNDVAVRNVLNEAIFAVLAGEADAADALESAQTQADELLAPYREP